MLSQHGTAPAYTAHTDSNKNKCFWGVLSGGHFIILMTGKTFLIKNQASYKEGDPSIFQQEMPFISRSAAVLHLTTD